MTAPTHTHTAMSPPPDTPQTPAPDKTAAIFATANPWLTGTLVGTLIGVLILMGATLTGLLVHEFGSTDDRFARLEANIDARFAAQDAKIDALDAKIDEMSLKLNALIAALDKTNEVDAALAGEIAPP